MHPADYIAALKAAQSELQEIIRERARLDDRLNQLKKTIDALSALLKDNSDLAKEFSNSYGILVGVEGLAASGAGDMGISDAIRQLLIESKAPLTPPEIRNYLSDKGFDFSAYANPLAVIHNTLKRLNKQGEIAGIVGTTGEVTSYVVNQHHPAMLLRKRTVPPPPGIDDIEDAPQGLPAPLSKDHPLHKLKRTYGGGLDKK